MEIKMQIPEYAPETGFKYVWESGFKIKVKIDDSIITIVANKEGLISLANHLLNLAQDNIPSGYHLHLDSDNSLEENSSDLILQKE
jgi:hypothetical protein